VMGHSASGTNAVAARRRRMRPFPTLWSVRS
jgi:hypothetical protein